MGSTQCLIEGVGFLQNFLRNVIHCKGTCRENFFLSISQQIKVNGVTLDECILP